MAEKTIVLNKERKVTLTSFICHKKETPAILILPGGAYNECSINEGRPVAEKFNSLGFNCFVLCYSVGKHYKWPYPLEDLESAMEHIKENSKDYCISKDKIILAGFSAGGHLAGAGATMAKNKPFAAILCYPALSRETIEYSAPGAPDITDKVDENTCPCFIASSRNDWIVPIENTHRFVRALDKYYIDYEEHIYGFSMHGFSIGNNTKNNLFVIPEKITVHLSPSADCNSFFGRYNIRQIIIAMNGVADTCLFVCVVFFEFHILFLR